MVIINKKNTGERLEFESFSNVTVEHLHRYAIASELVENKTVLDIASGEGYGSYLMAKKAKNVVGVDIDFSTVKLAKKKYIRNNLEYLEGSTSFIPLEDNSVDAVISFETIEHHDEHDKMMTEIKRVLKPDGFLLISSPDKEFYSDLPNTVNPYHIKELYSNDFINLINNYFKNNYLKYQNSYNFNSYVVKNMENLKVYSGDNLICNVGSFLPIYNLILASDSLIVELKDSIFNGETIRNYQTELLINIELEKIYKTSSFKIGNKIVKFLKTFKLKK
jgi:ubiquinone/menaquinone biosynthesis C-methylase UbiE